MAGSVNKVILVGNLGKDPEVRHTQDGRPIVNLSVATSENWRDKQTGERKERTEWHRVVIFNENLAKIAEQYLKKGAKVYLEGQLQTRKYTDKDGVEKYSTEVVLQQYRGELTMLDARGGGGNSAGFGNGEEFRSVEPDGPAAQRRRKAAAELRPRPRRRSAVLRAHRRRVADRGFSSRSRQQFGQLLDLSDVGTPVRPLLPPRAAHGGGRFRARWQG